jgi:hypothetical protein
LQFKTSNIFPEIEDFYPRGQTAAFLTPGPGAAVQHARPPVARPRGIAASLVIAERSAHGIVTYHIAAGYLFR